MFDRVDARSLNDLSLPMSRRAGKGVYFVRVCAWNEAVKAAVWRFHEAARSRGVILEGQIANPDERQLSYLNEVLGPDFRPDAAFLSDKLAQWMPRMSAPVRAEFAQALARQFDGLRAQGKNESILRNVYFKVMCWLYYRFERLMPFLGEDDPPRVLYECPAVTRHELILLKILSGVGADVLLLETQGDAAYLKCDPQGRDSQLLVPPGAPFPADFSLKGLRKEMAARPAPAPQRPQPVPPRPQAAPVPPRPQPTPKRPAPAPSAPRPQPAPPRSIDPLSYFKAPAREPCTNAWMKEAAYDQILTPVASRGDDFRLFYNAFIRVKGVPDKLTYLSELHQFYQKLRATGRKHVIVDEGIEMPDPGEIQKIRRRNYRTAEEMMVDLAGNLPASASVELQRMMQTAFVKTLQTAKEAEPNLNRLLISAVDLLAWILRWQGALFQGYRDGDVPVFILMGGCRNEHDRLYPLFLSRLPVDVLILAPDLNRLCTLSAPALLELTGEASLPVMRFPRDAGALQMRTLASHAEDDLTDLLYRDSGFYRSHQFARAESMTLQTTLDEIFILWNQELKYRSGFATVEGMVTLPVIYAKVSGVERGNPEAYWQKIKLLLEKDTHLARHMPMIPQGAPNPFQALALKAVRDGVLHTKALRDDRQYPFGILREELQQHIFDKLQLMLDRRLIRGTFENGTEYTVVATILNLDKALLRTLQSFDFTRRNPKLVCISTDDRGVSLEDAILITFLNLVGFDIVLFVPTGYQTIERWLNDNYPVEHQAGDYLYDLTVPDFNALPQPKKSWLRNILGR